MFRRRHPRDGWSGRGRHYAVGRWSFKCSDATFQLFCSQLCILLLLLYHSTYSKRILFENITNQKLFSNSHLISLLIASSCSCNIRAKVWASVWALGESISTAGKTADLEWHNLQQLFIPYSFIKAILPSWWNSRTGVSQSHRPSIFQTSGSDEIKWDWIRRSGARRAAQARIWTSAAAATAECLLDIG